MSNVVRFRPGNGSVTVDAFIDDLVDKKETVVDMCVVWTTKDGATHVGWSDMQNSELAHAALYLDIEVRKEMESD